MNKKYKKKIKWDKQIEIAERALSRNKALIEDTVRGTVAHKANTWTRKQSKNRSPIQ